MALSTTIEDKFLKQKLREIEQTGFAYEYKSIDDHWTTRIPRQGYPCELVYLCGRRSVRLWATGYSIIDTPPDEDIRKVVPTPRCYAIRLERLPATQPKLERWCVPAGGQMTISSSKKSTERSKKGKGFLKASLENEGAAVNKAGSKYSQQVLDSDYRCEWLEKKLKEFFLGRYPGRGYGPRGARDELRKATAAGQKSLVIAFEQILEFDMELARHLLDRPRRFLSSADRVLEEIMKIRGVHLRVRDLDKPSKARAKEIGKFIMVWGHVVDLANGGSRIRIQDLPKMWIYELNAPLNVKPWPGWGASWPLLCTVPSDLVGTVRLGNFVEATGVLTAERDEGVAPATTGGWHYLLNLNNIEIPQPRGYIPRWKADERAISDLFKRLFGPVDKLTVIDKHNVCMGTFPDTTGFRAKLKNLGFEIALDRRNKKGGG